MHAMGRVRSLYCNQLERLPDRSSFVLRHRGQNKLTRRSIPTAGRASSLRSPLFCRSSPRLLHSSAVLGVCQEAAVLVQQAKTIAIAKLKRYVALFSDMGFIDFGDRLSLVNCRSVYLQDSFLPNTRFIHTGL